MILLFGLPRRKKKSNDMQHSNELTEIYLNVELKDSKWPSKFWRSYLSLYLTNISVKFSFIEVWVTRVEDVLRVFLLKTNLDLAVWIRAASIGIMYNLSVTERSGTQSCSVYLVSVCVVCLCYSLVGPSCSYIVL